MALKNVLLFAAGAAAHFGLTFPEWRADTLTAEESETGYNQFIYPCANVPGDQGPVSDWPISGGSIQLDLHHDWTYVFVNLGLGTNVTNFNVTLTPQFWNATGEGNLCVPSLPLDLGDEVEDGQEASIQVVTVGDSGSALYNCANVRLVAEAEAFGGNECVTEGVEFYVVGQVSDPVTSDGEVPEASSENQGGGSEDGGDAEEGEGEGGDDSGSLGARVPAFSAVALAVTFAVGLTL